MASCTASASFINGGIHPRNVGTSRQVIHLLSDIVSLMHVYHSALWSYYLTSRTHPYLYLLSTSLLLCTFHKEHHHSRLRVTILPIGTLSIYLRRTRSYPHYTPILERRPEPVPGTRCELGFMGTVLNVETPHDLLQQQSTPSGSLGDDLYVCKTIHRTVSGGLNTQLQILASAPPSNPSPMHLFAAVLPKLWTIWECILLCDPIILFAASPRDASLAVWWLQDLIKPVRVLPDANQNIIN